MVLEPREKKNLNYFRFIRESILGNLSVTVFHSGHPSHLLKLFDQPYHRQKTLTASNFSGDVLFRHRPYHQVCNEEIFKFCQSTGGRISVTCRPCASTSSLTGRRLATLHLCLCHPSLASDFLGFFLSVGPLNSLSSTSGDFLSTPSPARVLGSVFLPFQ